MAQYVICVSFYFFSWGIHYIHFWWFFKFSLKQKWKSRLKWMSDDTLHNPTKLATKAYYYWWGESLAMLVFGSMATKGQLISKCLFGVFNFFKKRTKKVNLRYHSSKVEFVHSFFCKNRRLEKIITTLSDLFSIIKEIVDSWHGIIVCVTQRNLSL